MSFAPSCDKEQECVEAYQRHLGLATSGSEYQDEVMEIHIC